jgi:hypothetical protein
VNLGDEAGIGQLGWQAAHTNHQPGSIALLDKIRGGSTSSVDGGKPDLNWGVVVSGELAALSCRCKNRDDSNSYRHCECGHPGEPFRSAHDNLRFAAPVLVSAECFQRRLQPALLPIWRVIFREGIISPLSS